MRFLRNKPKRLKGKSSSINLSGNGLPGENPESLGGFVSAEIGFVLGVNEERKNGKEAR